MFILTDEKLVGAVTEILSSAGFEYNVSMGFPFTQSILYSFLVLLKSAIESGFHHTEFFAFIKHPLIKNAKVDNAPVKEMVYRLQEFMIQRRMNHFDPAREYGREYTQLCMLVKRCAEVVQQAVPLDAYIDDLIELLNMILSCNADLLKQTIPGIKEFPERLHRLARLRVQAKDTGGSDTLGLVLRALKDETREEIVKTDIEIYNHILFFAIVVCGLTLEWILRKAYRLT